jgi:hypothetical protein
MLTLKIIALLSAQGTARVETALYGASARAYVEAAICGYDPPIAETVPTGTVAVDSKVND